MLSEPSTTNVRSMVLSQPAKTNSIPKIYFPLYWLTPNSQILIGWLLGHIRKIILLCWYIRSISPMSGSQTRDWMEHHMFEAYITLLSSAEGHIGFMLSVVLLKMLSTNRVSPKLQATSRSFSRNREIRDFWGFGTAYSSQVITSRVSGRGHRIEAICVCLCVCPHSHDWTVWPMTLIFGMVFGLDLG